MGLERVLTHLLWFPDWLIVYKFRAMRFGEPFHSSLAILLNQTGLPMPKLYYPLMITSWGLVNGLYAKGLLDTPKAVVLSVIAILIWAPDTTAQMLFLLTLMVLLVIRWDTVGRALMVWMGTSWMTLMTATAIGGLPYLDRLKWLSGPYGGLPLVIWAHLMLSLALYWLVRDLGCAVVFSPGRAVIADSIHRAMELVPRLRASALPRVVLVLLIGGLYSAALSAPYLRDTPNHFIDASRFSFIQILTSIFHTGGYYRPIPYMVWRALLITGAASPLVLHLLGVTLHIASALLVYHFSLIIAGSDKIAFLTALLFGVYPFSYDAVIMEDALSHLSATLFGLLGTVSMLRWGSRVRGENVQPPASLYLASLAFFALAMLSHETGTAIVMAGSLVGLLMLRSWGVRGSKIYRLLWPYAGVVLTFALWRGALKPNRGWYLYILHRGLNDMLDKLPTVIQAIAYPILPWTTWRQVEPGTVILVVGSAVAVLLVLVIASVRSSSEDRSQEGRWLALSATWMLATLAIPFLTLDPPYLFHAPRTFYPASVGIALLWALVLTRLWRQRSPLCRIFWVVLVLGTAYSAYHIWTEVQVARRVGPLAEHVNVVTTGGQGALLVNLPTWIAPRHNPYPFSANGIVFLPSYVRLADFVRFSTDQDAQVAEAFSFPPLLETDLPYALGFYGMAPDQETAASTVRRVQRVLAVQYLDSRFQLVEVGSVNLAEPTGKVANFANQFLLHAVDVDTVSRDTIAVTVLLESLSAPLADYDMFVHIYANSDLIAQKDGAVIGGLYPTYVWLRGDRIRTRRIIKLPENLPEGWYEGKVGFYEPANGQRVPAFDSQNQPLLDSAVSFTFYLPRG